MATCCPDDKHVAAVNIYVVRTLYTVVIHVDIYVDGSNMLPGNKLLGRDIH